MASVVVTLTGDESRLLRAMDKVIAKERQLARKAADAGKASERAGTKTVRAQRKISKSMGKTGKARESAFGSGAIAQLGAFAGKLSGVAAAVGLVTKALTDAKSAREAGVQSALASELSTGRLAQLTVGDPAKFSRLRGAAKRTFAEGGALSLNQANASVFALDSAGIFSEQNRHLFSQLNSLGVDPAVLADSIAALQTGFGKKETGGARQIVSKGLAASRFAPASVDQLLEAAAKGGVSAKALGLSDEELLAATAIVSRVGGAAEGGTRIRSLLKATTKRGGFQGLGLTGILDKIQAKGLSDPELITFFGREEGLQGFRLLQENRGLLGEALQGQQRGNTEDLVGGALADLRARDPETFAARRLRAGNAKRELAERAIGVQKAILDGIDAETFGRLEAQADGNFGLQVGTTLLKGGRKLARFLPGGDELDEDFLAKHPRLKQIVDLNKAEIEAIRRGKIGVSETPTATDPEARLEEFLNSRSVDELLREAGDRDGPGPLGVSREDMTSIMLERINLNLIDVAGNTRGPTTGRGPDEDK